MTSQGWHCMLLKSLKAVAIENVLPKPEMGRSASLSLQSNDILFVYCRGSPWAVPPRPCSCISPQSICELFDVQGLQRLQEEKDWNLTDNALKHVTDATSQTQPTATILVQNLGKIKACHYPLYLSWLFASVPEMVPITNLFSIATTKLLWYCEHCLFQSLDNVWTRLNTDLKHLYACQHRNYKDRLAMHQTKYLK